MVDSESRDFLEKLKKLSPRERKVLELRCRGMAYVPIGKELNIALSTVKEDMSRVYLKLGLDVHDSARRIQVLYETICPLLKLQRTGAGKPDGAPQEVVEGEVVPETTGKTVPKKIKDMVDRDEYALVPVRSAPISEQPEEDGRRPTGVLLLIGGVVIGVCLCGAAAILILRSNNWAVPLVAQATSTIPSLVSQPSAIASPSNTAAASTPTPVVVIVTTTAPPVAAVPTSLPVPSIGLPFADSFEQGPSPSWRALNGEWITAGGRYTTIADEKQSSWFWSALDDPTWQNYRVTVNIDIPYPYSAAQGQLAVAVRMSNNQTKFLAFVFDTFARGGWAFLGTDESDVQYIAGHGDYISPTAKIELELNGNEYTARVNGQVYQNITLSGHDHGGIALGVTCDNGVGKCPSFGNLKVDPLGP